MKEINDMSYIPAALPSCISLIRGPLGVEVYLGLEYFKGVAWSVQGGVNHVGAGEHLTLAHQETRADDHVVGCADAGYG